MRQVVFDFFQRMRSHLSQATAQYQTLFQQVQQFSQHHGDPATAFVEWGLTLSEGGQFEGALEKFEKAVHISPKRAEAWAYWGILLGQLNRLSEAIDKFEHAIALEPDSPKYHWLWGAALLQQGNTEQAEAQYQQALALADKNDPEPYIHWGLALIKLNRLEAAAAAFQQAIALYPNMPQVLFLWGTVLAELGQYGVACEKFEAAASAQPKNSQLYYFWAYSLLAMGQPKAALEPLEIAQNLATSFKQTRPEYTLLQADCYAQQGYHDLAVANYREVLRQEPTQPHAWLGIGLSAMSRGAQLEALEAFQKALALDKTLWQAEWGWAQLLISQRAYPLAIQKITRALGHIPLFDAEARHTLQESLAWLYLTTQQIEPATALLATLEAEAPTRQATRYLLGLNAMHSGQSQQAVAYFSQQLDQQEAPSAISAVELSINLSLAYSELGQWDEAERVLRPFLRQPKVPANVLYYAGLLQFRKGQWREARQKYQQAVQQQPNWLLPRLGLVELLVLEGQWDEAKAILTDVADAAETRVGAMWKAAIALLQRQPEAAEAVLQPWSWPHEAALPHPTVLTAPVLAWAECQWLWAIAQALKAPARAQQQVLQQQFQALVQHLIAQPMPQEQAHYLLAITHWALTLAFNWLPQPVTVLQRQQQQKLCHALRQYAQSLLPNQPHSFISHYFNQHVLAVNVRL